MKKTFKKKCIHMGYHTVAVSYDSSIRFAICSRCSSIRMDVKIKGEFQTGKWHKDIRRRQIVIK